MNRLSHIDVNENGIPTLYVKEKPFLMLAGELHNSASSSLEFMEREVWPYLRPLKMNTVIMPIAWENIEEKQGHFDFSLLKGLIDQARREEKRIVLLWFGLWKNGESFYVPEWVKEDYKTYFRACYVNGFPSDTISPFCEAAVEADKNAFCKLMEYLREYDSEEQTVIMVQVENEIGFLGAERDFSLIAEEIYDGFIPEPLYIFEQASVLDFKGIVDKSEELTWTEAFGEDAPEIFMAYHYAKAVERIASAGKNIYPLPMYVNAWLKQHPDRPGVYPSGGPVYSMLPIWKLAAPSVDFFAPDIYVPDFKDVCEQYSANQNLLFIPEARRDPITASNAFYAFGSNAAGFSPFAIEDFLREDFVNASEEQLQALNIEVQAFCCQGTGLYLQRSYEVLHGMLPEIVKRRGTEKMKGFIQSNPNEKGVVIPMEGYDILIDYTFGKSGSAGIILAEKNGFYIAGCNVKFTLLPKRASRQYLTVVRMEEGEFVDGHWKRGRIMNGDELHEKKLGDMAEVKYVKVCLHSA